MPKPSKPIPIVICGYCGKPAELKLSSAHLYGGIDYGPVWQCVPCGAYVGCHKNSAKHAPLGRLANAELRKARGYAHAAFDRLWQGKMRRDKCSKAHARHAAYHWLADQLGIKNIGRDCHIAKFDLEQCQQVERICKHLKPRDIGQSAHEQSQGGT